MGNKMITIRKAEITDIDAIQALYKELDSHHVELLPDTFRPVEGDIRSDESIGNWIQGADRTYLVALCGDQIVGFVSLAEKSYASAPMYVPKRYGLVDNAVVASTSRRVGIGHQLFNAAIAWLQARGIDSVQVQVWNKNEEAMRFYAKQGFKHMYTRMQMSITPAEQFNAPDACGAGDF